MKLFFVFLNLSLFLYNLSSYISFLNIIKLQKLEQRPINDYKACTNFRIVIVNILLIKSFINCNSTVNYIHCLIEKIVIKRMISLNIEVKKDTSFVLKTIKIDENNRNRKMALIQLDITISLQVLVILGLKIRCLKIILSIIHLVYCLIIYIVDIKCLLIFYYKLF